MLLQAVFFKRCFCYSNEVLNIYFSVNSKKCAYAHVGGRTFIIVKTINSVVVL